MTEAIKPGYKQTEVGVIPENRAMAISCLHGLAQA